MFHGAFVAQVAGVQGGGRRKGSNCYNDEHGLYFKWGLYHTDGHRVLYNDELRIGEAESTYADVAPPGRR